MQKIAGQAMENFAQQGGISGLIILALIVLLILMIAFMQWYIKTQREYENGRDKNHSEQYEKRLIEERKLIDAIHALVLGLRTRPCMRQDSFRSKQPDNDKTIPG